MPEIEQVEDTMPAVEFGQSVGSYVTSNNFTVTVLDAGSASSDGFVTLVLQWAGDIAAFEGLAADDTWTGNSATLATGVSAGAATYAATGLAPSKTYAARVVAVNDNGDKGATAPFTLSTAALEEDLGGGDWGLLQQQISVGSDKVTAAMAATWDETAAVAVEGAIMPLTAGSYTSAKTGATHSWSSNRGFIYKGYIRLQGGVPYTFGSAIDDCCYMAINGQQVIYQYEYSSLPAFGTYTAERTGYYPIEIRMGNGSGGSGQASGYIGLGYNTTSTRTCTPAYMSPLVDPGDGSLLRIGVGREISIASYSSDGTGGLNVSAALAGWAGGDTDLYVVWGSAWAGEDTNAWDHVALVRAGVPEGASTVVANIADASQAAMFASSASTPATSGRSSSLMFRRSRAASACFA